jgi:hypothetical protein
LLADLAEYVANTDEEKEVIQTFRLAIRGQTLDVVETLSCVLTGDTHLCVAYIDALGRVGCSLLESVFGVAGPTQDDAANTMSSEGSTSTPPNEKPEDTRQQKNPPIPQYVNLDQAAAWVNRSKRTLERYLHRPKSETARMPEPDVEGTGGKPHEWLWTHLRPWLEATFGKSLPESLPSRASRPADTDRH